MRIYAAPMEGITGYVYRNAHHHFYPGMDRYYTPFLSPKIKKGMNSKEKNDVIPEHNQNISVIPQILTNQPEEFLFLAEKLDAMGYEEWNLNLGCPSGTVVTKGKGCGFLANPDRLRRFFEETFEQLEARGLAYRKFSVKTRLGMEDPEEILTLMEIYNDYPISEVTIHARVHKDFYKRPVNRQAFKEALAISRHPVCYNGDLFTVKDYEAFTKEYPQVEAVMLGRGLIADPQLEERLRQPEKAMAFDKERFFDFHEEVLQGYVEIMSGDRNVLFKMKELWTYMNAQFPGQEKVMKKIKKSNNLMEYRQAVRALSY